MLVLSHRHEAVANCARWALPSSLETYHFRKTPRNDVKKIRKKWAKTRLKSPTYMDGSLFSLSFSWKIIMFQQLFLWKFLPVNLKNQSPQTWNLNPPRTSPASRFPGHLAIVGTWWVKPGRRNSGLSRKHRKCMKHYTWNLWCIYTIYKYLMRWTKHRCTIIFRRWSSTLWHQTCHVWRLRRLEASRVGRHHRITPSSHGDGDVTYVEWGIQHLKFSGPKHTASISWAHTPNAQIHGLKHPWLVETDKFWGQKSGHWHH